MIEFTEHETAVLNYVQKSVPLAERPYAAIASKLGISENESQEVIASLKRRNIIRNIAGIFNGGSLGYSLNLVAMEIPEHRIDKAAALINSHPGVSHNYVRGHRYNIWFTLAEESTELFKDTVDVMAKRAGARDYLILKNEKLLKIGVVLPIGEGNNGNGQKSVKKSYHQATPRSFTQEETEAILLFQTDLPVINRPFRSLLWNENALLTEERLLGLGTLFVNEDIMRRYSAVLRHVNAGFKYNAMTTWKIQNDAQFDEKSRVFIDVTAVSHLYLRTIFPGKWDYPLFAMIHAKTETELKSIISSLSKESGLDDYLVLKTEKELKKKKVIYFSRNFEEWRDRNYD